MFADFTLISGPCLLEDHGLNLEIARELSRISRERSLPIVFKASFDKANRSRHDAERGPGLAVGLEALARVKEDAGLPVLTDIHEPAQASAAAEVVDVLQIPAFLCRQSDLIIAAGRTGKPVNIKKGQWIAPEDMAGAVEKARRAGAPEVAVTERGTFLGYGDLVVDMRAFPRVARACGVPVIFDGTHAVQRPGRVDGASGGDPEFVPALVRAAVAAGCSGLFLEVHPDPTSAPSDGSNMLPLAQLGALLDDVLAIRGALGEAAASSARFEP
ncbi:MAG: 3-deoxy-8-phosphooctulonate synthase [Gemmatimonadota bacterium]|nr:MAG: 3-deoxy-8-phosphooctulonate synthase [Gemmatimonadota bacterium]